MTLDAKSVPDGSLALLDDLIARLHDQPRRQADVIAVRDAVAAAPPPPAPFGSRVSWKDEDRASLLCPKCTVFFPLRTPENRAHFLTPQPMSQQEAAGLECDGCGNLCAPKDECSHCGYCDATSHCPKCCPEGMPF